VKAIDRPSEMVERGIKPNEHGGSAAISACKKGGQRAKAKVIELLRKNKKKNQIPNSNFLPPK
jgi:hypothetical protein